MTSLVLAVLAASPASPAHAMLERARAAGEGGDASRAAALAMQAVRRSGPDPGRAIAIHRGAQDLLLGLGKGDQLVRYYDHLLRSDVRDAHRRYLRARVEPDASRRRRDLESVLLSSPDMFWAAYDLAEALAREGNWGRAVEYAERAVKMRPGEKAAWNVLGHLRLEQARMRASPDERKLIGEKAREALKRAVELDGGFLEALYNLGLVTYLLGDEEEASRVWRKALAASPDFAPALNSLGHLAARKGRLDEAIEHYERAIRSEPTYGTAHNNLAVAYYRKKEYRKAQKHLALAEANGYEPVSSFKRALVRAVESEAFDSFKKTIAGSKRRAVSVSDAAKKRAVRVSARERDGIVAAIVASRFRDSHGGVSFAEASSRNGGERRIGDTVVARYVQAARIVITLDGDERLTLAAIAREAAATRKRALTTWFADADGRFSAHAPDLARVLAAYLGLPVHGAE